MGGHRSSAVGASRFERRIPGARGSRAAACWLYRSAATAMIRCLPAIVEGPPRLLHCECRRCKNARPIPCPPDDSPNAPQDFIEALLALYDSHYMWATATAA